MLFVQPPEASDRLSLLNLFEPLNLLFRPRLSAFTHNFQLFSFQLSAFPMPPIFITGTAGFIGFHLARRLLDDGHAVFGLDNFNDYYSVQLKLDRHAQLEKHPNYRWLKADLADGPVLQQVFADFKPECVVNLAAQPGVRYSITNPQAYQKSNTITATCTAISHTWTILSPASAAAFSPTPSLVTSSSTSVTTGRKSSWT